MILSILADATPSAVLMTSSLFETATSHPEISAAFAGTRLLVAESNEVNDWSDKWKQPGIAENDIAFLQYTSGSTTTPRGVMVTHGNLLHNLSMIEKCVGQSGQRQAVNWLPPYHDMGLIGSILQPLYSGFPMTLMPHLLFLQKPYRWLQAISRLRATASSGPNFAYDLCVSKIKPAQRELLDLSSWEVAFNGAEQVYHKTLDRFAEYFAPCGFRREAFLPCYGLAEATLLVTGGPRSRPPVITHVVSSGIEQNQVIISANSENNARTMVSCGHDMHNQKVKIVNVETMTECSEDQVGEVWVSGPSVTHGYWNKPAETKSTFKARLSDNGREIFLRTGDMGFVREGGLYITGRLKDLIICDGNNHYPNDIEKTVESAHPAIRPGGCAAFSINNSASERLVIIAEIEQQPLVEADEIIKAIRKAVSLHHDLRVDDIKLTKAGYIPRTFSGKIKHYLCKSNYLTGTLKEIALT
jgi:acyl-CoA synthetase (AMP-forming)/AMP-acid ligase II